VAIFELDPAAGGAVAEAVGGLSWAVDVGDDGAVRAGVAEVEARLGPVGVLINNAGIMPVGAFAQQPWSSARRQVAINLLGVMSCAHAVLPGMLARGRGRVVNVASLAGELPTPYAAAYTATKFAVVGFSEALRLELRGAGVSISCALPAFVKTELVSGLDAPWFMPAVTPDEVAAAVVGLARSGRPRAYVPGVGRLFGALPALLPRRLAEALGARLGLFELFASPDEAARAAYRARAG